MRIKSMLGVLLVVVTIILGASLILSRHLPRQSAVTVPKNWNQVELGSFSFFIPPDLKQEKTVSTDSSIWVYQSNDMRLEIDLGPYSNTLQIYDTQPQFLGEFSEIDGGNAKLGYFRLSDKFARDADSGLRFIAAVHFPGSNESEALTFWASCKESREQDIARIIFHSIRFNKID